MKKFLVFFLLLHILLFSKTSDTIFSLIEQKDIVQISSLIDKKNINYVKKDTGESYLMIALSNHEAEIAKLLVEKGTDINIKNKNGSTALIYTAVYNEEEIAELLIKKGADINEKNNFGNTALYLAAYHNSIEVAKLLIEKGADINIKNNHGWSALMIASFHNSIEVAKLLIEKGTDINVKDNEGWSALDIAEYKNNLEIVEILKSFSYDKNGFDKEYKNYIKEEYDKFDKYYSYRNDRFIENILYFYNKIDSDQEWVDLILKSSKYVDATESLGKARTNLAGSKFFLENRLKKYSIEPTLLAFKKNGVGSFQLELNLFTDKNITGLVDIDILLNDKEKFSFTGNKVVDYDVYSDKGFINHLFIIDIPNNNKFISRLFNSKSISIKAKTKNGFKTSEVSEQSLQNMRELIYFYNNNIKKIEGLNLK